jgi:4-amino-4-deoxy-L-arabinose transferase-like glycosyltransferase
MKEHRRLVLGLILFVMIAVTHLPGLGSFVATDEPAWLTRGVNFYYALSQREFQNTVYEYHPSVTTMWYVATATLIDFPEYRGLGNGYFDVDKEKFDPFLIEHGHHPMTLLFLGRLFQVIVIGSFILLIFYLLSLMVGDLNAFFITVLLSSAPYFLGHSRLLSHEGQVAAFVLASIVGMLAYLEYERKWYYLLISALAAALAQLTKSSAMAMFPVIAMMLLISMLAKLKIQGFRSALIDHLKIGGSWFIQLSIVYFVLWPGMWVAPRTMLYEVYGNAFSYAFQGARLDVTQELQPSSFSVGTLWSTAVKYFGVILWKSTPVTWLGVIFAGVFVFVRDSTSFGKIFKRLVLYLFVTAVMFILLFSLAQGRNSPHYMMSSYVSIEVIAAFGWCALFGWLGTRYTTMQSLQVWVMTALILFQIASSLAYYPYYHTYNNPLLVAMTKNEPQSDYGEGFEQAAQYLAQKPNAASLNVMSFRGRGPFSYFFPGHTILLNPLFVEPAGMPSLAERFIDADYLVVNAAFGPRTPRTQYFMNALKDAPVEHEIHIRGVSPIYIYRVSDLPPSFYEVFLNE